MFGGRFMRINGHSMAPALAPNELVFVQRPSAAAWTPSHGELVAVRPEALGGKALVKRVAGLPWERVHVAGREWQLGTDEFFLLGDQPKHSLDSRMFGPVRRQELIGPIRKVGTRFLSPFRHAV